MERFEGTFENIEVADTVIGKSIDGAFASSAPEGEVEAYMAEMRSAYAIDLKDSVAGVGAGAVASAAAAPAAHAPVAIGATSGAPVFTPPPADPPGGGGGGGAMGGAGGGGSGGGADALAARLAKLTGKKGP